MSSFWEICRNLLSKRGRNGRDYFKMSCWGNRTNQSEQRYVYVVCPGHFAHTFVAAEENLNKPNISMIAQQDGSMEPP